MAWPTASVPRVSAPERSLCLRIWHAWLSKHADCERLPDETRGCSSTIEGYRLPQQGPRRTQSHRKVYGRKLSLQHQARRFRLLQSINAIGSVRLCVARLEKEGLKQQTENIEKEL